MPEYFYNNNPVPESQLLRLSEEHEMSLEDFIEEFGVTTSKLDDDNSRETSWLRGEEGLIPDEFQPGVNRPRVSTEVTKYQGLESDSHVTASQLEDHRWGFAEKDIAKKLTDIYGDKFEITEAKEGIDAVKIKNKANGKWETIEIDDIKLGMTGANRPYEDILNDITSFIESSTQEDVEQTEDYTKRKAVRDITGEAISTDDNLNYIDLTYEDEGLPTDDKIRGMAFSERERFFARDGKFGFGPIGAYKSGGYNPDQAETNTEKLEEITSDISSLFQQELKSKRLQFGKEFTITEATKEQILETVFEKLNKAGDYLLPKDQFDKIVGGSTRSFLEKEIRKEAQVYKNDKAVKVLLAKTEN